MSLPVKVFVHQSDGNKEIHRLTIDQDVASSFSYLCNKLSHAIPELKTGSFTISWKDEEGDNIVVSCDDELVVALGCIKDGTFRIQVNHTPSKRPNFFDFINHNTVPDSMENDEELQGNTHPRVTCDGCSQGVTGYRYKCLECSDYDLCTRCEQAGVHPQHYFLRISTPKDNPGFIPPFVGTVLRNYSTQQWGPRVHKRFMKGMHRAAKAANHWSGGKHCNFGYPYQNSGYSGWYAANSNPSCCNQKKPCGQTASNEPKPSTSGTQDFQQAPPPTCDQGACGGDPQQQPNPFNFLGSFNPQVFQNIWTALGGLSSEQSGQPQDGTAQQAGSDNAERNSKTEEFWKNIGDVAAAFLEPLGMELEMGADHIEIKPRNNSQSTPQQTEQKKDEPMTEGSETEKARKQTPESTPVKATPSTSSQSIYPSDSLQEMLNGLIQNQTPSQQTSPQKQNADGAVKVSDSGDWAYVDRREQGENCMETDDLVVVDIPQPTISAPNPVTPIQTPVTPNVPTTSQRLPTERDRNIADARSHLLDMGFNDEGGWLSYLLDVKNGDIHQVLDSLQHGRH